MKSMRRIRTQRRISVAVLLLALLAAPFSLPAREGKENAQGIEWRVKYVGGTAEFRKGTKVRVTVGKEILHCEAVDGRRAGKLSIPVASVTEISDSVITGRVLDKVFGPDDLDLVSNSSCTDALSCGGVAAAQVALSVVAAPISLFNYEDHFVRIEWKEMGEKKEINFRVGKKDSGSFLAELRRVTGLPSEENPSEEPLDEWDAIMRDLTDADSLTGFRRAHPPQGERWRIKLMRGLSWEDDGYKAKVILGREEIFCESAKGGVIRSFSIPVNDVNEISYVPLMRPLGESPWMLTSDHCKGAFCVHLGTDGGPRPQSAIQSREPGYGQNPLSTPMGLATEAALSPELRTQHLVLISWRNKAREEKEAVFQLGYRDYLSFLAELQAATGKEWKDLTGERERRQEESLRAEVQATSFQPRDKASVAERDAAFQHWLAEECQPGSSGKPVWLRPSSGLNATGLCASSANVQVRNQVLARSPGE